jgi:hypothetical protein
MPATDGLVLYVLPQPCERPGRGVKRILGLDAHGNVVARYS